MRAVSLGALGSHETICMHACSLAQLAEQAGEIFFYENQSADVCAFVSLKDKKIIIKGFVC